MYFFLYKELGVIALSGKFLNLSELNSIKSSGFVSNLIKNFLVLFDVIFTSPYFLGISFFLSSSLVFISFLISKKDKKNLKLIKKIEDILILTAPLPFCFYTYLKYDPYGRSVFCFIPSIIISLLILSEIYNEYFDYQKLISLSNGRKIFISPFFCLILMSSCLNLSIPIISKDFMSDNPNLYYKALDKISQEIQPKNAENTNIWSRDISGALHNENYNICNSLNKLENEPNKEITIVSINKPCKKELDFFVLTNVIHDSMPQPSSWEYRNMKKTTLLIMG